MSRELSVWVCSNCGEAADPLNRDGTWRFSEFVEMVEHVCKDGGIRYQAHKERVWLDEQVMPLYDGLRHIARSASDALPATLAEAAAYAGQVAETLHEHLTEGSNHGT